MYDSMGIVLKKRASPKKLKGIREHNNALEGVFWPLKERLFTVSLLYDTFLKLTPYRYKPFVKSFKNFTEYAQWKKEQRNPWLA